VELHSGTDEVSPVVMTIPRSLPRPHGWTTQQIVPGTWVLMFCQCSPCLTLLPGTDRGARESEPRQISSVAWEAWPSQCSILLGPHFVSQITSERAQWFPRLSPEATIEIPGFAESRRPTNVMIEDFSGSEG
jgi:hypothetical protein